MVTPRERRHESTKERILDAARKILVENGLNGLSIRKLAERIDYTPSAIYKYFDSKEAILQAIRAEGFEISAAMQADNLSLPLRERLLAAGRTYLRFAEQYPEHYQLMFGSPDLPPASYEALLGDSSYNNGSLPGLIQQGLEQGILHLPAGYTAEMFALQAWVTVHGIAMFKLGIMHSIQAEFDTACDQMLQCFIDSFFVFYE